ncbi:esterase family protein [Allosphingosinicella flava]|uniref:Esterase family protein n=1 Tax=Allosphingosinicella flava TaxID=2771430 RepID=A0A7T2GLN4_9SPHN|nr:alpha/beta hydrolase-fold protein [Sphingosinicella flava]QPQ56158.1 esterase family protein [Sphingosinicella flava]
MIRAFAVLSACLIAMAMPQPGAAAPWGPGQLNHYRAYPSRFAAPRDVSVWLPPGYDRGGAPYAVLYAHDGQNLFDPSTGYGGKEWGLDETAARLIAEGKVRPFIIVGIWNTPKRMQEYLPGRAYAGIPSIYRKDIEAYYGGPALADGYLRFIAEELKPFIDRHYNTAPGRESTFVMGSSMGGIVSLAAIAHYPQIFGGAASLSTHWPMRYGGPDMAVTRAEIAASMNSAEAYLRAALPRPGRHRLYIDSGAELDLPDYAAYQKRIDAMLKSRGWTDGKDWLSRAYPGMPHNEDAWRARVDVPLQFLLGKETAGAQGKR